MAQLPQQDPQRAESEPLRLRTSLTFSLGNREALLATDSYPENGKGCCQEISTCIHVCAAPAACKQSQNKCFFFFLKILFIFRERRREREKGEEKHQCVGASCVHPSVDLARNPRMCPDWELNQRPFASQSGAQSPEPHQPGHKCAFLIRNGRT